MPGPLKKCWRDAGEWTIARSLKVLHKWRKTVPCHPASFFFDLSAFNDKDGDEDKDKDKDSDNEDEGVNDGDLAMSGPQEVVRGGWAVFASHLDDICCQYEENAGHGAPHNSPCHSQSAVDLGPIIRVYKLDILLGLNSWTLQFLL